MSKPFRGVINIDIKQSTPDWEPYTQPKAPDGAPNVLYIVLDDVGFAAMEPVTDDYPGQRPWAFTGGTIKRLIIDVSGQPFVDLAKEAAAAYARQ
jgi:hypothetical protein